MRMYMAFILYVYETEMSAYCGGMFLSRKMKRTRKKVTLNRSHERKEWNIGKYFFFKLLEHQQ